VRSTRAYAYIFPAERRVKSGDIYRVSNSFTSHSSSHGLHLPHLSTASLSPWLAAETQARDLRRCGTERWTEAAGAGIESNASRLTGVCNRRISQPTQELHLIPTRQKSSLDGAAGIFGRVPPPEPGITRILVTVGFALLVAHGGNPNRASYQARLRPLSPCSQAYLSFTAQWSTETIAAPPLYCLFQLS